MSLLKYKKNKTSRYALIVIISAIFLLSLFVILKPIILGNSVVQNIMQKNSKSIVQEQVEVTKENFEVFLESQKMIIDLPLDSLLLLKLYNLNNGNKNWEESYILKKGKVEKGNLENPDITIFLSSEYIKNLPNFCNILKLAKANGDISYDTKMNQISLLWKYRRMMKYRNCFGL